MTDQKHDRNLIVTASATTVLFSIWMLGSMLRIVLDMDVVFDVAYCSWYGCCVRCSCSKHVPSLSSCRNINNRVFVRRWFIESLPVKHSMSGYLLKYLLKYSSITWICYQLNNCFQLSFLIFNLYILYSYSNQKFEFNENPQKLIKLWQLLQMVFLCNTNSDNYSLNDRLVKLYILLMIKLEISSPPYIYKYKYIHIIRKPTHQ